MGPCEVVEFVFEDNETLTGQAHGQPNAASELALC